VDSAGDQVIEAANAGIDLVRSSISPTLGDNFENLRLLGSSSLNGTGNSLSNLITGNDAANVLKGAAGADTLRGNGGADDLYAGVDSVRDTFVFAAVTDSGGPSSPAQWDEIFEFNRSFGAGASRSDVIDLQLLDADAAPGDQAFRFVGSTFSAPGGGQPSGQVRIVDTGPHINVEIDIDGNSLADMVFTVRNVSTLSSGDFLL
jgi:Ca2+-binding RTX toxin-like protein